MLAPPDRVLILPVVNGSWQRLLPVLFIGVAALTRWPGLFPPNFSAFYALAFCAGAFFPARIAWWVPLGTLLATDLALNCYYQFVLGIPAFQWFQLTNYAGFALLILLGRGFGSHRRWLTLLGGGLLGACLFYLFTNTAAWLFNPFHAPEYTRDLAGWLVALSKGTAGYPPTWEFFRNTLLSGGLFTGLFAGVAKWSSASEPRPSEAPEAETEPEPETEPAPESARP
jgi:hypothetical protein